MNSNALGIAVLSAFLASGCATVVTDPNLVFYCTFDNEQSILQPSVGPVGTSHNPTFVEGASGKALFVPAHTAVAEFPFSNGLPTESCTIEFWARIANENPYFKDGVDPYLFIITKDNAPGWPVIFECNFNANNGSGAGGFFCGMSFGRAANFRGDARTYASILGADDPKGWHKYTIEWCRSGLDANGNILRASIDDKIVCSGIRSTADIEKFFADIQSPSHLVFSNPKTGHGNSAVEIDDFKILPSCRKLTP